MHNSARCQVLLSRREQACAPRIVPLEWGRVGIASLRGLNYVRTMPAVRRFMLGVIDLRGEDRVRFLHGMATNDIAALQPGQGCHAAMLTTKGKLLADFTVAAHPDRLRIVLGAVAAGEGPRAPRQAHHHGRRRARSDGAARDSASTVTTRRRRSRAPPASTSRRCARWRRTTSSASVVRTPELGGVGFHVARRARPAPSTAPRSTTPSSRSGASKRARRATASTWAKIACRSRPASTTPSASPRAATSARR